MHVLPLGVSDILSTSRRRWHRRVTIRPVIPDEVIMLFGPHHARERLPLNVAQIVRHRERTEPVVKFVGLLLASLDHIVKVFFVEIGVVSSGKSETDNCIMVINRLYV